MTILLLILLIISCAVAVSERLHIVNLEIELESAKMVALVDLKSKVAAWNETYVLRKKLKELECIVDLDAYLEADKHQGKMDS